ncbi:MAG: hypothetical protein WC788_02650 [Candidatus Paceibacterota bacterium]|jgi:hypothetical protein
MSELEESQIAAKKKYELEQAEINAGKGTGKKAAVLGKTVIGSRKKYEINQVENIVPGSTHPSDVRTVKNQ